MNLEAIAQRYVAAEHKDRHGDKLTTHSYIPTYSKVLRKYRQKCRLLEVGVAAGLSMRMWQEWMPDSLICGLDCSAKWFTEELRKQFQIAVGYSNVPSARLKVQRFSESYDVIIDDGDHDPSIQIGTFHNLFPILAAGGTYVIEDIPNIDAWEHEYIMLADQYGASVEVVDLRSVKGRCDDVLAIYRSAGEARTAAAVPSGERR